MRNHPPDEGRDQTTANAQADFGPAQFTYEIKLFSPIEVHLFANYDFSQVVVKKQQPS